MLCQFDLREVVDHHVNPSSDRIARTTTITPMM
jgi:hypothetical protein